ncbi:hypothetical protein NG827_14940 [Xanthomonas sacchari]|uniref:hypothetical protein n=1 Tax=Xanthomonas sacchari TaxID=56458 RepID=UPI00225294BC|nr:hypothetical protein [Xanthomonas sacchari]UYK83753.1 hypothetical protein NG827_14940 [Xanthomonas sacchari]
MELEKALEMRDLLLEKYQLQPSPRITRSRSLGMNSRIQSLDPPSIGLGVTESPLKNEDYFIAVRVQSESKRDAIISEEIKEMCGGEAEILHLPVLDLEAAFDLRRTHRPLQIGSSIANLAGTAGTLGLIVRKTQSSGRFILSNHHVLVGDNTSDIVQPGPADHGSSRHRVATLAGYEPISFDQTNYIDAAIAEIDTNLSDNGNALIDGRTISRISTPPLRRAKVSKIGRTTGHTTGTVRASGVHHVKVKWSNTVTFFSDCIEITGDNGPFSQSGDSGSVILDENMSAVGLLFAGGKKNGVKVTYACNLTTVMNLLDLSIDGIDPKHE